MLRVLLAASEFIVRGPVRFLRAADFPTRPYSCAAIQAPIFVSSMSSGSGP
jgi:hypothetical protein